MVSITKSSPKKKQIIEYIYTLRTATVTVHMTACYDWFTSKMVISRERAHQAGTISIT